MGKQIKCEKFHWKKKCLSTRGGELFASNLLLHSIRRLGFNNGSIKVNSHDFAYSVTVDGRFLMNNTSCCKPFTEFHDELETVFEIAYGKSYEQPFRRCQQLRWHLKSYLVLKVVTTHKLGWNEANFCRARFANEAQFKDP